MKTRDEATKIMVRLETKAGAEYSYDAPSPTPASAEEMVGAVSVGCVISPVRRASAKVVWYVNRRRVSRDAAFTALLAA
jgi:hypothetical protein